MIYIYTNSLGSKNSVVIKQHNHVIFEGQEIKPHDLAYMLQRYFATGVKYEELSDEEMEKI